MWLSAIIAVLFLFLVLYMTINGWALRVRERVITDRLKLLTGQMKSPVPVQLSRICNYCTKRVIFAELDVYIGQVDASGKTKISMREFPGRQLGWINVRENVDACCVEHAIMLEE